MYFRHISGVPEICSMGWNINHSASLWKKNAQLVHKDWIWSLSVPCFFSVFWLSVCGAAKYRIHLQNKFIHQNTLNGHMVTLVTCASVHVSIKYPRIWNGVYSLTKCDALTLLFASAKQVFCSTHKSASNWVSAFIQRNYNVEMLLFQEIRHEWFWKIA